MSNYYFYNANLSESSSNVGMVTHERPVSGVLATGDSVVASSAYSTLLSTIKSGNPNALSINVTTFNLISIPVSLTEP